MVQSSPYDILPPLLQSRKNNYTLLIAPDGTGSASGYLYLDDGESLNTDLDNGFTLLQFTLSDVSCPVVLLTTVLFIMIPQLNISEHSCSVACFSLHRASLPVQSSALDTLVLMRQLWMLSKYLGCQKSRHMCNSMELIYINQSIHLRYVYVQQCNFVIIIVILSSSYRFYLYM